MERSNQDTRFIVVRSRSSSSPYSTPRVPNSRVISTMSTTSLHAEKTVQRRLRYFPTLSQMSSTNLSQYKSTTIHMILTSHTIHTIVTQSTRSTQSTQSTLDPLDHYTNTLATRDPQDLNKITMIHTRWLRQYYNT